MTSRDADARAISQPELVVEPNTTAALVTAVALLDSPASRRADQVLDNTLDGLDAAVSSQGEPPLRVNVDPTLVVLAKAFGVTWRAVANDASPGNAFATAAVVPIGDERSASAHLVTSDLGALAHVADDFVAPQWLNKAYAVSDSAGSTAADEHCPPVLPLDGAAVPVAEHVTPRVLLAAAPKSGNPAVLPTVEVVPLTVGGEPDVDDCAVAAGFAALAALDIGLGTAAQDPSCAFPIHLATAVPWSPQYQLH